MNVRPTETQRHQNQRQPHRPRVVIVGAGFAGLNAAKLLRNRPVDVTLLDRNNYHRFQPLLYQVATAGLEPGDVAHNVRDIFRKAANVTFRMGTVRKVNTRDKCLLLRSGPPVFYDYLILAAGAVTNYFGIDGARTHALPLKNLPDAIDLRNRVLRLFERVDRAPETAPEGALNVVIVGGGPTGVEMAGALVELFDVMQKDYKQVDTHKAQVYLLEMQPDVLPPYPEPLQRYTRRVLEKRGVRVMTETTVEKVTDHAVHLKDGDPIPTQTLIWAAGVQAHPVSATVDAEQANGGRLIAAPDLRLPGLREVFVAGDVAGRKEEDGGAYPQLAPVAVQQGKHAARQVLRMVEGRPTEPFVYDDPGTMATIGRHAAVADLNNGRHLKGFVAWIAWVLIHIAKLVGFRNRLSVFISWIYNYFSYDRSARLILDVVPISEDLPHEVEYIDQQVKEQLHEKEQKEEVYS